jgi:hypothetical protein
MLLLCFSSLIEILAINYIFIICVFVELFFLSFYVLRLIEKQKIFHNSIIWMIGILTTDDDLPFISF